MVLKLQLSGGIGSTSTDGSLGGARSGTDIVDATGENIIDNITRKEVLVGKTEYRCYYVYNASATLEVHGVILFIDQDPSVTTVTMGLDPAGSGNGQTTGVAQIIATEDTTPTGITFEDAGEFRVKLALPMLRPLESQAIWLKRIAAAGPAGVITIGVSVSGNEEDVIPADLTITGNTLANPTVVTTGTHGLVTGNQVTISGSNSTPTIDGEHTITFVSGTTFSVPVNVTIAGTAGTVAVGGNVLDTDGLSIGERTNVVTLSSPFLIGTARIGFSEIG